MAVVCGAWRWCVVLGGGGGGAVSLRFLFLNNEYRIYNHFLKAGALGGGGVWCLVVVCGAWRWCVVLGGGGWWSECKKP